MIHMLSGRWPEPQVGPNRTEPGKLIPVTEAERREVFLQAVGDDHPLMDLILKCIDNHPQSRAHASEIVEQLSEMVLQFPASFTNLLVILRHIEAQDAAIKRNESELESKTRILQEKEAIISEMSEQLTRTSLATKQQVSTKLCKVNRQLWKYYSPSPI